MAASSPTGEVSPAAPASPLYDEEVKAKIAPKIAASPRMAETIARALEEASPSHRVLREMTVDRVNEMIARNRVAMGAPEGPDPQSTVRRGFFTDFETTGLDPEKDRVIQMAVLEFDFDRHGICGFDPDIYVGFQDPGMPIPPEVTALTGITDEMVAGQKLDFDAIRPKAQRAALFVAHNSGFDRLFGERLDDAETAAAMRTRGWLCSSSQIDWKGRGMASAKLGLLAMEAGWFFGAHRADNDCLAGVALLASGPSAIAPDGSLASKYGAFSEMMRAGASVTYRIWAKDSPFSSKDKLKARGYFWDGDGKAGFKSWWRDVDSLEALVEEKLWLATEIYPKKGGEIGLAEIGPRDRFSIRALAPDRNEFLVRQDLKIALDQMRKESEEPSLAF